MTSSLTMLVVYAALLLIVLLTPYASSLSKTPPEHQRKVDWAICSALLTGAITLTVFRHGALPLVSVFVLMPLIGLGNAALLGGVTAALLFATTIWWTNSLQFGPLATVIAAALALVSGFLPRWKQGVLSDTPHLLPTFLVCTGLGIMAGLLTAPFEASETIYLAWHHWGAYLAPVEAWRGGGIPYRDFPIQYGLGPTFLLMANCGQDCWRGMYEVVVAANALYFATLVGCVMILTARSSNGVRWLALMAMFCATFFWTGFPSNFAGPVITPSVAGLRFLSISALLLHILHAEQNKVPRDWIGHAIWLIDLFWSPEAAFFGTLVWWPYLALRDARDAGGWRAASLALTWGALRAVCALAVGLAFLATVLWLLSARAITFADFFAYVQHPPGALPVNLRGTIWIALATLALSISVLARQGLSDQARPFYSCLLGFMAAGTYYISRSHDNNVLNLFPLLILVLLASGSNLGQGSASRRNFAGAFVHTSLAAMIAFIATFDFGPWSVGAAQAGALSLGPARLISRFMPSSDDRPAIVSPDATDALRYVQERKGTGILLLDRNYLLLRSSGPAWTGVNNLANFVPLPITIVRRYIQNGAAAYHRPGWIVVNKEQHRWVSAFRSAYDTREQKSFGSYQALYLVPRVRLDPMSN